MIPSLAVRRFPATSSASQAIYTSFPPFRYIKTSVEQGRRSWEETARNTPLSPETRIEALDADGVKCEKISCGEISDAKLIVHFHGGGYNAGSCLTHRDFAARLSSAAHAPVLVPEYRLAPEAPYPAAVEDAVHVYQWLLKSGVAPTRIIVLGDSAGGGLAAALLLALKEKGEPLPLGGVLISAWLDLSLSGQSYDTRTEVERLTSREDLADAAQLYIGEHDPREPLISPLFGDLAGLPPLLIQAGDYEVLLSDSLGFTEKTVAVGCQVELQVWEGMWHVWHGWAADLPEARQAIAEVGRFVSELK